MRKETFNFTLKEAKDKSSYNKDVHKHVYEYDVHNEVYRATPNSYTLNSTRINKSL